jgi:hypothetical protein
MDFGGIYPECSMRDALVIYTIQPLSTDARGPDSNSHSSGTFVGVVGSSEYEKGTPASPPPSRRSIILIWKWNYI